MIQQKLQSALKEALEELGIEARVSLEHPNEYSYGDFATNVALQADGNPRESAEKIMALLKEKNIPFIDRIEVAGPGFINFYLTRDVFVEGLKDILEKEDTYGSSNILNGEKTIVEYTDPNPFKAFHIGHLMSNAIGESLSRIIEFSGAEVKRANYQGDMGLHIAKALWGIEKLGSDAPADGDSLEKKVEFLGNAYAFGANSYKENESIKKEIDEINVKVYEKSNEELNRLYKWGREISLEKFEAIYKILGTSFDFYFYESGVADSAKKLVEEGLSRGLFQKSDGAVIYKGEEEGLHTRVFMNSRGLVTYEAKDLALSEAKFKEYEYEKSYIITANEVDEYFKVVLRVMGHIFPELALRTEHVSHGMLRLPTGKMSSRAGNVITGESLIEEMLERAKEKMQDRDLSDGEKARIAEKVAVGAIKYSILKQAPGRDIIFDMDTSLSFEGDSGPYIQYTYVRTRSILEKAKGLGKEVGLDNPTPSISDCERILSRFPEVVERALHNRSPHFISTYVTELSSAFNAMYGSTQIISDEAESPYLLALTKAVSNVLKNGLLLLGIEVVEEM